MRANIFSMRTLFKNLLGATLFFWIFYGLAVWATNSWSGGAGVIAATATLVFLVLSGIFTLGTVAAAIVRASIDEKRGIEEKQYSPRTLILVCLGILGVGAVIIGSSLITQ